MSNLLSKSTRGFTLVEVSLAVAIFAVGILAILGLLPMGLTAARSAADRTIAATVANSAFSQLRMDPFTSAFVCTNSTCTAGVTANLTGSGVFNFGYTQAGYLPGPGDSLYFRATINYTNVTAGLTKVTATITWPYNSSNPPNTNSFATQVAWYDR